MQRPLAALVHLEIISVFDGRLPSDNLVGLSDRITPVSTGSCGRETDAIHLNFAALSFLKRIWNVPEPMQDKNKEKDDNNHFIS